jgi:hypothetical protein
VRIRYYMVCSRFEALVASHLDPEAFGLYMAVGNKKLARGHVVFFEISPDFAQHSERHFHTEGIEQIVTPHEDGSPKRSKYLSVYRVLEFLPLSVFQGLYLTTMDGRVMRLDESPYDLKTEVAGLNLYQELCPLIPLVVSSLAPARFIETLTNPASRISAPRLFFADLRLDRDSKGMLDQALPYSDRLHIVECLKELEQVSEKPTKTVSRTPRIQGFFRAVRRGFFLGDQTGLKFYRFPDRDDLAVHHAPWWRSASAQ